MQMVMFTKEVSLTRKHGVGTFRWTDGDSYTGEWQNNAMHGQGVFHYADGTKFEGRFENNLQVAADKKQEKEYKVL